ncbi:MAG: class I SAM-dependent RNA methyltransferase, partial [Flavobacterium sp.]
MARRKKDKVIFRAVEVIDAGARGISVGKTPEGQVILIPNVVPGDVVDVQTFKKKKSYYEGKPIHFHQYSSDRTEPVCEHFGVCGGCKWQNMTYEKQLFFKEKEVYNNLKRIGKIELPNFEPILGSENTFFYRNKMEFSFSDSRWLTQEEIQKDEQVGDKNALGFHIPGMWDKILDINKCHLQADPSNEIRNEIKRFAVQENIPFYNARTLQGLLRTLMMRNTSLNEWMVLLQFFYDDPELIEKLMSH